MQLPVAVDPALPQPLQEQLFRALQRLILAGIAGPGTVLPGSRQLAQQLAISRNTVMLTVDRLAAEGYISALRGRGMVVNPSLPESFLAAPAVRRAAAVDAAGAATRRAAASLRFDFRVGRPDMAHFPIAKWRRTIDRQLLYRRQGLFDYGEAAGDPALRRSIAALLGPSRGIAATANDVVIVSGLPEALHIAAAALSLAGRRVVVEKPCYARAVRALQHHGARIDPVAVDRQGLRVETMSLGDAGLVFVSPSHQFPLGYTLSLERRVGLLTKAKAAGAFVFEDDYDSDFRHEGSPLTALKGLDGADRVIYFGTFSKSLGPGLRIAYVVLPKSLRERFVETKAAIRYGHAWLEQAALAQFIADGDYQSHLRRIRRLYTRRRDALTHALRRRFGDVELSGAGGGMHLAWHLPKALPGAGRLAAAAARAGVGVYPIDAAPAEAFGDRSLRDRVLLLGYACLSEAQIEQGVRLLAESARR